MKKIARNHEYMDEKRKYKFRAVVSEVSSFSGEPYVLIQYFLEVF